MTAVAAHQDTAEDPIVIKDGGGREHDCFVERRGKEVVVSCPTAFWSMTLDAEQAGRLMAAIQAQVST